MATASDHLRIKKGKIFIISLVILGIMVAIPFLFSLFVVPYGRLLSKQSISTKEKHEQVVILPVTPVEPKTTTTDQSASDNTPLEVNEKILSEEEIKSIGELIQEATRERYSGNFQIAQQNLEKALEIGPRYTPIFINLAELYEAFDDKPKAIDALQRVLELDPDSTGKIHREALAKMNVLRKKLDEEGEKPSGIPQNQALFFVEDASPKRDNNALFDERLILNIKIAARLPVAKIDPALVKIQVYFYDLLSNNQVSSTKAQVKARFLDRYVDWATGPESMEVVYEVPKGTWQREVRDTGISRNLYGYIVRIYYDNKLEDIYAEPTQLAQLFPAKEVLGQ